MLAYYVMRKQKRSDIMESYRGIDVSKWQGEINWSKVKNDEIGRAHV